MAFAFLDDSSDDDDQILGDIVKKKEKQPTELVLTDSEDEESEKIAPKSPVHQRNIIEISSSEDEEPPQKAQEQVDIDDLIAVVEGKKKPSLASCDPIDHSQKRDSINLDGDDFFAFDLEDEKPQRPKKRKRKESGDKPKKRRKLTSDEKKQKMEEKKQKKEEEKRKKAAERQRKKQEKEWEKQMKKRQKQKEKFEGHFNKGKDSLYYIRVIFDKKALHGKKGQKISDKMSLTDWRVSTNWQGKISWTETTYVVPALIRFQWRQLKQFGELTKDDYMEDYDNLEDQLLDTAVVRITGRQFCEYVREDNLEDHLKSALQQFKLKKLIVVCEGVKSFAMSKQNKIHRFYHVDEIDRIMHTLLFETHSRIIHTYTRNAEETALYIARTTRALAEYRWRDPPTILSLTKKQKLTGEIEKNSGPMEWFIKMILHIDNIGEAKARAIVNEFGSIRKLYDTYSRLTQSEGEKRLKDLVWKRNHAGKEMRIGPAASKKIYNAFFGHKSGNEDLQDG